MTASLRELARVVNSVRVERRPKALRGLRATLLFRCYRELRTLPPLRIELDDSDSGRLIRAELGITMIRFAAEVPNTFEEFVASHNRANNLRKSMRRAEHAGISFAVVDGRQERATLLSTVLAAWGTPDDFPGGLTPDVGTYMVARDPDGRPLAMAISLSSVSTTQLAFLVVDRSYASRSVVRYALTAFAIRVAIEGGAKAVLLTGAAFSATLGIAVLANNSGFHPRRILMRWDMAHPNEWAARLLYLLAPPARDPAPDQLRPALIAQAS